jgi:hypothetical protein
MQIEIHFFKTSKKLKFIKYENLILLISQWFKERTLILKIETNTKLVKLKHEIAS